MLGFEKLVLSKMLCEGTCRRLLTVDNHVGIAVSGMLADGRQLVNRARDEAAQYREFYGHPIPGKVREIFQMSCPGLGTHCGPGAPSSCSWQAQPINHQSQTKC